MFIHGDGHVHIHGAFDLSAFFAAALREAEHRSAPLFLLLVETEGVDYFTPLAGIAARGALPGDVGGLPSNVSDELLEAVWLRATREPRSLAFGSRHGSGTGFLIRGRQCVSAEGIEVLAVGLDPGHGAEPPRDRTCSARELVQAARYAGALAVLPWGLGKWWGARGARVAELASDPALAGDPLFLLGDTAHRFRPWPTPRPHRGALRVLAGTDPLPVPGAEQSVGSYGFRVAGDLDPERPAASLLAALGNGAAVESVGRRASPASVLRDQVRYRLRRAAARG